MCMLSSYCMYQLPRKEVFLTKLHDLHLLIVVHGPERIVVPPRVAKLWVCQFVHFITRSVEKYDSLPKWLRKVILCRFSTLRMCVIMRMCANVIYHYVFQSLCIIFWRKLVNTNLKPQNCAVFTYLTKFHEN